MLLPVLLKLELPLGRLKVTCLVDVGDLDSGSVLLRIGTMVVLMGDVLTVVVDVMEVSDV